MTVPLSIADCLFTTGWSVQLAEQLQTAAIVLSDQFLGQSTAIITGPEEQALFAAHRAHDTGSDSGNPPNAPRYAITDSGISARSVPGDVDRRLTADGLEHNERGTPSASAGDHRAQLDKRARTQPDVARPCAPGRPHDCQQRTRGACARMT